MNAVHLSSRKSQEPSPQAIRSFGNHATGPALNGHSILTQVLHAKRPEQVVAERMTSQVAVVRRDDYLREEVAMQDSEGMDCNLNMAKSSIAKETRGSMDDTCQEALGLYRMYHTHIEAFVEYFNDRPVFDQHNNDKVDRIMVPHLICMRDYFEGRNRCQSLPAS